MLSLCHGIVRGHYSLNLFPVLGPASLSVLQLNRSELVHMRHVMVKIELDSRLQGGQREVDTMMARLEAGRVCVVCTRSVFFNHILLGSVRSSRSGNLHLSVSHFSDSVSKELIPHLSGSDLQAVPLALSKLSISNSAISPLHSSTFSV